MNSYYRVKVIDKDHRLYGFEGACYGIQSEGENITYFILFQNYNVWQKLGYDERFVTMARMQNMHYTCTMTPEQVEIIKDFT